MRKLIDLFFGPSTTDAVPATQEHGEASMNFDSEYVRPFLERLVADGALRIDASVLQAVELALADMKPDETRQMTLDQQSGLVLEIFMDDIDAPDLYFFGPATITDSIDDVMMNFAEENGF